MLGQELFDFWKGLEEVLRELRMAGSETHQDETTHSRTHERFGLDASVADASVSREDDPMPGADSRQPLRVWSVLGEMVVMELNAQLRFPQVAREDFSSQSPIAEEDDVTQPAGRGART